MSEQSITLMSESTDSAGARAELARVEEMYLKGLANHEQVEVVEKEVLRADREAKRDTYRADIAEAARADAARAEGDRDLEAVSASREQLWHEIGKRFPRARGFADSACQEFAAISDLVSRDPALCVLARDAAARAGIGGEATPVTLANVQAAFAASLTGGRHRPRHPATAAQRERMVSLLREGLAHDRSVDEIAQLAELILHDYYATIALDMSGFATWLAPLFEPPAFLPSQLDHYRRALRVLAAIENAAEPAHQNGEQRAENP
jgi:hypothetical protein